MKSKTETFVIAGGGLAGAKAAETLRDEGFDGRIVIVGDEPERPYERPPLSKEFLRGEGDPPYVHEESFYSEKDIELRTGARAVALDPDRHELELDDGETVGYSKLLIATGAEPRRLDVEGADLDGVRYLRTLADSRALGERIAKTSRVVVVGSGWIGAEIAASARSKGVEVTMIEMASLPLERVLGPELGGIYLDIHRDHGVEFLSETTVERFEGDGRLERVLTRDGAEIEAELAVVGVGVVPRYGLAEGALRTENGILVDERLRTSAADVFAAGDVANARHPFYERHVRVEHWANALNQGPAAARSMLGQEVAYDEIPYFFSDQYDVGMEYGGYANEWDEVVFRGDVAAREFAAFWVAGGRLVAGMNVNVWDVNEKIRELIRARTPIDTKRLADPDVPLAQVAQGTGVHA